MDPGRWKILILVCAGTLFTVSFFSSPELSLKHLGSTLPPACIGDLGSDFQCHKKYLSYVVEKEGVRNALDVLKKTYETNGFVKSQCHQLSHVVGNTAFDETQSVSEAFLEGDALCWSGYYHGVVERAVGDLGRTTIEEKLNDVCKDIPGKEKYSFDYYNCVHGLGHGLMAMTRNELFESLNLCDTLLGTWEQGSCYGGVYMENVMVDFRDHKTTYLKDDDLLYPCTAVADAHKYQCYLMQTSYVLKKNGYNFSDVFERCRSLPSPYNTVCAESAGRDASGLTISDPLETKKRCDLAGAGPMKDHCLIGAAKDFVSYFHSDKEAYLFCSQFSLQEKVLCDETVRSYYVTFN